MDFLSYAWLRLGFPYLRCDLSVTKFTLKNSVVIAQNYALNESIVWHSSLLECLIRVCERVSANGNGFSVLCVAKIGFSVPPV